MAGWFKHDIAAWMDGTENLDHEAYRAYHVICQLIYLNEGPIRSNSEGIAGRAKMSVRMFRRALETLISLGLISEKNGRLSNSRAEKEIENLETNRKNASKGGKSKAKSLENNDTTLASLPESSALRLEKTRLEKKESAPAPIVDLFPTPKSPDAAYYARFRELFGKDSGSLAKKLLTAKNNVLSEARAVLEASVTKDNPKEYIGGAMKSKNDGVPESWVRGDDYG
jgi:uncharacterized protein YdaU (DUF1376 family)